MKVTVAATAAITLVMGTLELASGEKSYAERVMDNTFPGLTNRLRPVDYACHGSDFMSRMAEHGLDAAMDEAEDRYMGHRRRRRGGKGKGKGQMYKPFRPWHHACPSRMRLTTYLVDLLKSALSLVVTGPKIGHVVRLSFHDCVGGCDGCLNLDLRQNLGIWADTVAELDQIFDFFRIGRFMSRADFYQLAGIVAIENGARNAGRTVPIIPFRYGRVDCPTSPLSTADRDFGSGHMNRSRLVDYFAEEFDFSLEDTVAIMGAHTVGEMSGASGFLGFFKGTQSASFQWDENYYKLLLNRDISYSQVNMRGITDDDRDRWQWDGEDAQGNRKATMLQADAALVLDLEHTEGFSACDFDSCSRPADSVSLVEKFTDFDDWMTSFTPAYLKMTSHPVAFEELKKPRRY